MRIDHLNITQLPSLNLSLSQLPPVQINVGRIPTVGIALQQQLEMNSSYTIRARVLGLDLMRMELQGTTKIVPRDCARREQSHAHERSFPDVAPAGNPAIPSQAINTCTQTVTRCAPSQPGKDQTSDPSIPMHPALTTPWTRSAKLALRHLRPAADSP